MRETCKYILLLEWSSFVDTVNFLEVAVVDGVGPVQVGEGGNGTIQLRWKWEGNHLD